MKNALFVFLMFTCTVVGKEYEVDVVPAWINNSEYQSLTSTTDDQSPISILLHERQFHVTDTEEVFHRYVFSINTLAGLSKFTHLNIDYDPIYQQVVLHQIDVVDETGVTNQLNDRIVRNFNLENQLDENIYTGQKRLNILLENLKVHDQVHVAYSLVGQNPVFKGYFFQQLPLQFGAFAHKVHYRVFSDKEFNSRVHNGAELNTSYVFEGNQAVWITKDVPASVVEDNVPTTSIFTPWLQITEFESWSEVRDWANDLFYQAELSRAYEAIDYRENIVDWYNRSNNTSLRDMDINIERLLFSIRNRLRYTMNAQGVHSHQAHDPSTTVNRGYGDCKDKVNIILAFENNMAVKRAYPVLVNTEHGHGLEQWLPTPAAFNHAIVLYRNYDDSEVWLDPTITTYIDTIENQTQPDYGFSLILHSQVDGLVPMFYERIPQRQISVSEVVDLTEEVKGTVFFDVNITLYSYGADYVRNMLVHDREQLSQNLPKMYERFYPEIRLANEPEFELDHDSQQVIVKMRLQAPAGKIWKAVGDSRTMQLIPAVLSPHVSAAIPEDRVQPFAIPAPIKYVQQSKILFPFEFEGEIPDISIENSHFSFNQFVTSAGRELSFNVTYTSSDGAVKAKDFDAYNADLAALQSSVGINYSIKFPGIDRISDDKFTVLEYVERLQQGGKFDLNWSLLLLVLMSLMPIVWVLKKLSVQPFNDRYEIDIYKRGIDGKLFVFAVAMGLGVVITLAMDIRLLPLLNQNVWGALLDQGSASYHTIFGFYFPFLVLSEVFILLATCTFTYLFFKKRYSAIRMFYLLQGSKMAFFGVCLYVTMQLSQTSFELNETTKLFVWPENTLLFFGAVQLGLLAYFAFSGQVKHTLTKG